MPTRVNRMMTPNVLHSLVAVASLLLAMPAVNAATPGDDERYFETHIRPILAQHCFECHGATKQWAELRLDNRPSALKGGETGPAVVPGKPDESRLIEVIQYSEYDSQMPPDGKLSDEEIARLTEWVAKGVPWPESAQAEVEEDYFTQAKSHWAFQPVTKPEIPALPEGYRASNSIDHFVAAKLQANGLKQSPRAEPRTLLRRLSYDLTGLPVTYDEATPFANSPNDAAYAEWVEKQLASEDFGPKWARYWLDIARYADTKGYVFTEERRYPFAYTYRDYVIKSLNEDLPYDQFIREQLAADLLPEKRSEESLAALGFLTVGQRFLNRRQEIINDQIDVTSRGFLGMTLACARCHDHKFDPLEAADYYAMYGVFDSTLEPEQLPQIGEADDQEAYKKYVAERDKRQQKLTDYQQEVVDKVNPEVRDHFEHYLLQVVSEEGHTLGKYELEEKYDIRRRAKDELKTFLRRVSVDSRVYAPWRRVAGLKNEAFTKDAPGRLDSLLKQAEKGEFEGNAIVLQRLKENRPAHMYDFVKMYASLAREAKEDHSGDPQAAAWEELREAFHTAKFPMHYDVNTIAGVYHRDERNKDRNLVKQIDSLMVSSPGAPPRAMIVADKENPVQPVIFKRGNPGLRGDKVDRRFLKVLDFVRSEPFPEKTSGRLQLAESIATPDNPLTARVHVNRIWMQLVGQALVETTDDFGLRTPLPTHPELLDYLAWEFMQHNWSNKWLIREIVMSETYRQAALANAEGNQKDLENRLIWRMNRKRMPFESMRDGMLFTTGMLNEKMYGRPVSIEGKDAAPRRSIFGFIDRNNVSNLLRTFDVAEPSASVTERPKTTVPQQALYLMNSPFIMDLANHCVENAKLKTAEAAPAEKVTQLYRRLLQRDPTADEKQLCVAFVTGQPDNEQVWSELTQTLLLTNDFMFLD